MGPKSPVKLGLYVLFLLSQSGSILLEFFDLLMVFISLCKQPTKLSSHVFMSALHILIANIPQSLKFHIQ